MKQAPECRTVKHSAFLCNASHAENSWGPHCTSGTSAVARMDFCSVAPRPALAPRGYSPYRAAPLLPTQAQRRDAEGRCSSQSYRWVVQLLLEVRAAQILEPRVESRVLQRVVRVRILVFFRGIFKTLERNLHALVVILTEESLTDSLTFRVHDERGLSIDHAAQVVAHRFKASG